MCRGTGWLCDEHPPGECKSTRHTPCDSMDSAPTPCLVCRMVPATEAWKKAESAKDSHPPTEPGED